MGCRRRRSLRRFARCCGARRNARVVLGDVVGFDLDAKEVVLDQLADFELGARIPYDSMIVAGGSQYSYFGHDEWQADAPELKSLTGALEIRSRILTAFEAAEVEFDPGAAAALTFVVVGAGPTGVEMAGQIAELAHYTLRRDFRVADTRKARVLLVQAGDRVLEQCRCPIPKWRVTRPSSPVWESTVAIRTMRVLRPG